MSFCDLSNQVSKAIDWPNFTFEVLRGFLKRGQQSFEVLMQRMAK
jgi:hypothetical protein